MIVDAATGASFPVVVGLETDETDIMYGRIVNTPAGYVRVETTMVLLREDDRPACTETHCQTSFWGTLQLAADTELTWGPGFYQLAGQDRVDLMAPQETELASFDLDDYVGNAEPLTRTEIETLGLHRMGFHNSASRWVGDVDEVLVRVRAAGLVDMEAKIERLRAKGATELTEILSIRREQAPDPAALGSVEAVGMTGGSAFLWKSLAA